MNKRYRLGEIEEAVAEMEELIDIEDDIAEIDDDFQIVVSGWSVYVESLNLTLRQGIACVWDAEEGLFMPDFDVTIVYEGNIETQEWLYYEQDGMVVTLGNWLNGRLSCEQIEQLWCELIIPEQNKEQKESRRIGIGGSFTPKHLHPFFEPGMFEFQTDIPGIALFLESRMSPASLPGPGD